MHAQCLRHLVVHQTESYKLGPSEAHRDLISSVDSSCQIGLILTWTFAS